MKLYDEVHLLGKNFIIIKKDNGFTLIEKVTAIANNELRQRIVELMASFKTIWISNEAVMFLTKYLNSEQFPIYNDVEDLKYVCDRIKEFKI